jgi:hypothetical protein
MAGVSRPRRLIVFAAAVLLLLGGAARAAASIRPSVSPVVGSTPTSETVPPGFLGLSMEFYAVHEYTGSDPDAINPVLI